MGLEHELERLEKRLSNWEDMAADGDMTRDRFIKRRNEVLPRIHELKAQLSGRPHVDLPDVDQFFGLADRVTIVEGVVIIDGELLDNTSWRELMQIMVDRITVEATKGGATSKSQAVIRVTWKPEYAPFMTPVG